MRLVVTSASPGNWISMPPVPASPRKKGSGRTLFSAAAEIYQQLILQGDNFAVVVVEAKQFQERDLATLHGRNAHTPLVTTSVCKYSQSHGSDKRESTISGPGAALVEIVRSLIFDTKRIHPGAARWELACVVGTEESHNETRRRHASLKPITVSSSFSTRFERDRFF